MTNWRDSWPQAKTRLEKVRKNVRAQIFDVYSRVLLEAPFITSVQVKQTPYMDKLVIARDSEIFELSVLFSRQSLQILVMHKTGKVGNSEFGSFGLFKPYFSERFQLEKFGKVRRSALIFRKKLEMLDIYQVLNS